MSRAKQVGMGLGLVLGVVAVGFFGFAPAIVESSRNVTWTEGPWPVSAEARAAHDALTVVDLHTDSLLWDRDLSVRASRGHVDLPRLREANVAIQAFTVVTKTPKGQNYDHNGAETDNIQLLMFGQLRPPKTWFSLEERAHAQARALHALEGPDFQVITDRAQMENLLRDRQRNPRLVGGLLGIEGMHAAEGDLEAVDRLFKSGFRIMAPVHFFDNELGGSAHGIDKGGLTDFGKQVVRRQEELGIAVDLAHGSEALIDDVLAMARKPVISTHTGVRGTCDRGRNLSDAQLQGIARTGGVVGIAFFEEATCGKDTESAVKAILHAVSVIGEDHVAFGSDFDGSVATPWDITGLPQITAGLREAGLSEAAIEKISGENTLRVLRQTLPN